MCVPVWIYISLFVFKQRRVVFSLTMSQCRHSFVWDSQVKELRFTAPPLKQHCTQIQDRDSTYTYRCVSGYTTSCQFSNGWTVKFVRDTTFLHPLPKSPPIHRMLVPLCSTKIRGFKIKPCDVPIFPSLRSVKIQHKVLFLCMYKNRFISNVILSKRSSSLANTASFRKAKMSCIELTSFNRWWCADVLIIKDTSSPHGRSHHCLLQTFQWDRLALMLHQGCHK